MHNHESHLSQQTATKSNTRMKRTKSSDTHSQKRQRKRTPDTNHAHGANGRPVVLANVRYSVDIVALKEYAATDEAGRTKASSNENDVKSGFT